MEQGHVVAHVARDAEALVNLLTWARTGVTTPMYASGDQRAREIEDGARQPVGALRTDLLAADGRLAEEFPTCRMSAGQRPCGRHGAARCPPLRCPGCGCARYGSTPST
ncbi:maleylpyruvate isomerase N-terminal domain-containing protein [Streptomyces flaveus]|uniref:maleylpyruvate isomerase N-terminal domain-containing protein n=1 Tax=Streptomyces flaveus TaxID=66370 RepID=UPI0035714426